jgi:hypothetical protein
MKLEQKRKRPEERAAQAYLQPWQRPRLQQICQGRGTSGLPPVAWKHIIGYVSAIAPKQLRGVREVATDLASASATCSDMRAAVLREWPALAQFCVDQQLPLEHAHLPQHVQWERLLAAPLRHKVTELQSALRSLNLSVKGTPAVLAQRLLKYFKLSGPAAVPLVLVWAVQSEHTQFKRALARLAVARQLISGHRDSVAAQALQQWKQRGYRAELLQGGYGELLALKQEYAREKREAAERQRIFNERYGDKSSKRKYNRRYRYW